MVAVVSGKERESTGKYKSSKPSFQKQIFVKDFMDLVSLTDKNTK